jgi:hypothetical protein
MDMCSVVFQGVPWRRLVGTATGYGQAARVSINVRTLPILTEYIGRIFAGPLNKVERALVGCTLALLATTPGDVRIQATLVGTHNLCSIMPQLVVLRAGIHAALANLIGARLEVILSSA